LAVEVHVKRVGGTIVSEFVEVESGKSANRAELAKALATCKLHKAVLLVAKLDRLARNVALIANLMESNVEFVACDFPDASRLTVHVLAAVAEHERAMISTRTKEALAAAKARGKVFGLTGPKNLIRARECNRARTRERAERLRGVIEGFQARGLSQRAIVRELNALGVRSPGGRSWHLRPLQRVIARLAKTCA
jgi:DNA invertase Pin-like site-specific DNA recombinase